MLTFSPCWKFALCVVFLVVSSTSSDAQELTSKERRLVKSIASSIDRAGRQYNGRKYESSAKYFAKAQSLMEEAVLEASPALLEALESEHARLGKAHELLVAEGQDVQEVKPLTPPMAEEESGDLVSFKGDVAPIIVAQCGRCHVQGNRGRFSAATFMALMDSGHVDPGKPEVSRLIEVIEDGDMPPGGSLTDQDLQTLKQWIKQGAKSDADSNQNLTEVSRGGEGAATPETAELEVVMATGNESVSFANDIAPLLVENCSGCHVDVRNNARGGLNMTTFRQLIRGGDTGAMLKPGAAKDSLLVKKLLGTGGGNRMPQGRNPLNEKAIQLVTTWIDEGAKFDGGVPTIAVRTVAARAKAASLSHDELTAERKRLATEKWKIVMTDTPVGQSETADVQIVSSYDQERVDSIASVAQALVPKIRKAMDYKQADPLVKGKVTLYLFERRYDFNEFGVMVEGREIPKSFTTRWGFDTINAYVALLMTRNKDAESVKAVLARGLVAVHIASLAPEVPQWFADGMGYLIAEEVLKGSEEVKAWETESETAALNMEKPNDFISGRLREDQAALVGYFFVKRLRQSDTGRFEKLLKQIRVDGTFQDSFQNTYGSTPAEYVGAKR